MSRDGAGTPPEGGAAAGSDVTGAPSEQAAIAVMTISDNKNTVRAWPIMDNLLRRLDADGTM
jgi:hypothetical protein